MGTIWELHANLVSFSRESVIYVGQRTYDGLRPDLARGLLSNNTTHAWRPCRSVLRIESRCNEHVLSLLRDESRESERVKRAAREYLSAMAKVHLPVVNRLIQSYRLATYDYFPFEVSPWDVPFWYCISPKGFEHVRLLTYAAWDGLPRDAQTHDSWRLITPEALQEAIGVEWDPAEFELVDAVNRMERGDYSGAVRRVATAIEAEVARVFREELLARMDLAEAEAILRGTRNNFPERLRQYEELATRTLTPALKQELEATRSLRHDIVHRGKRIDFHERGVAQRSVDTGKWIFNWLQRQEGRTRVRDKRIAFRSLGRDFDLFRGGIDADGATVTVYGN